MYSVASARFKQNLLPSCHIKHLTWKSRNSCFKVVFIFFFLENQIRIRVFLESTIDVFFLVFPRYLNME